MGFLGGGAPNPPDPPDPLPPPANPPTRADARRLVGQSSNRGDGLLNLITTSPTGLLRRRQTEGGRRSLLG